MPGVEIALLDGNPPTRPCQGICVPNIKPNDIIIDKKWYMIYLHTYNKGKGNKDGFEILVFIKSEGHCKS